MDLSPTVWVIIILAATAISGVLMWWSSGPRKKR
jgi:hypothetical protein